MNFQIAIDLPEHGSCIAEFVAFFNWQDAEWDASDPVSVSLADEDEEPLDLADLDVSSQLIVTSAVQQALADATPSEAEQRAEADDRRGESQRDCDACR